MRDNSRVWHLCAPGLLAEKIAGARPNSKHAHIETALPMSIEGAPCTHYALRANVYYYQGEKVFYLIPPTPANLKKYSSWSSSYRQNKVFFGNQVDKCYEAHVHAGKQESNSAPDYVTQSAKGAQCPVLRIVII